MEPSSLIEIGIVVVVIGLIIYGLSAISRRGKSIATRDRGIGTVRRLYFYGVSFVALIMSINGTVQIGMVALDMLFSNKLINSSSTSLAIGLSLTIVGIPLWITHWRIISRYHREIKVESISIVRQGYIYLVLGLAAGIGITAAIETFEWIFNSWEPFSARPWISLIVWGGVWAYHWKIENANYSTMFEIPALRNVYIYLVSAATLIMLSIGLGQIVHLIFQQAYLSLTGTTILTGDELWSGSAKTAVSLALVGGPIWAIHWIRFAPKDVGSTVRHIYLFALVFLGSVIAIIAAVGITINETLIWTIGSPNQVSAVLHFQFLPGALTSLIVGSSILSYHRWAAMKELGLPIMVGPQNSYRYALAAVSLIMLVPGISILVYTALTILTNDEPSIIGADTWQNGLSSGLTLGLVGGLMWSYYWIRLQHLRGSSKTNDSFSLNRRVFIFSVLGIGVLIIVGNASFIMFVLFREFLGGDPSQLLQSSKFSISIILSSSIFVLYYWKIYKTDRHADHGNEITVKQEQKNITALLPPGSDMFISDVEAALGYRISSIEWADAERKQPELSGSELDALSKRIMDAPGANILLVLDALTVKIFSYH